MPDSTPAEAPAPTSGRSEFIPDKPTMGGLEQIGSDTHAPWTGGPPNTTWTALENPNPTSVEPTQYRPTGIGSAAKSQKYRISGLEIKFAVDDDLMISRKISWIT